MPSFRPPQRFGQRFFNRPTQAQSKTECPWVHSHLSCPLNDWQSFTVERDQMQLWATAVLGLLAGCRPSAVFFAIWAVVINSIKRLTRWTCPHVFKEICKTRPAFTYCNSASAVILVVGIIGVVTALFQGVPHPVFRGSMLAVNGYERTGVAPAGAAASIPQFVATNNFSNTIHARTATEPVVVAAFSEVAKSYDFPSVIEHADGSGLIFSSRQGGHPPLTADRAREAANFARPASYSIAITQYLKGESLGTV